MLLFSVLPLSCHRLGLVPRFFEFLSLEHSNNNVHNIRLCRLVIVNADLTSVELADMQVADKVGPLLHVHHMHAEQRVEGRHINNKRQHCRPSSMGVVTTPSMGDNGPCLLLQSACSSPLLWFSLRLLDPTTAGTSLASNTPIALPMLWTSLQTGKLSL